MRVACEGWKRIPKYHKLMDRDISSVGLTSKKITVATKSIFNWTRLG
jgi:hypothetical protein